MIAIRVVGLVGPDGTGLFADINDKYIADIGNIDDPTTWRFTDDISQAKTFDDFMSAYPFYTSQSRTMPLRPWDGQPNRPLRAFTIMFEPI